ncbi:MAG: hypothetical protein U0T33_02745 [Bacteroidales bacterium]
MNLNTENLKNFFDKVKSITFWKRLFSWGEIKILSYEAYDEFSRLSDAMQSMQSDLAGRDARISSLENDQKLQAEKSKGLQDSNNELRTRISALEPKIEELTRKNNELTGLIARHDQAKETREAEYQKNISNINALRESLEKERQKIHEEKLREREASYERMKQTWHDHEVVVKERIRKICLAKDVEYIDKVPFKGNPDNTIQIADEYVIFDAKSPAGDDLENFPKYIKLQTEQVKKYIKQENVKSDIFLVIPSNTLELFSQYSFNMAEYNVYLITIDSLEPIISFLKKLEEYSFVNQLSPEERDNICRIIGRFIHTTKRKIQVDQFFSYQFLEIITRSGYVLPEDIARKVEEYEKAEKLNPPQEKRAKQISAEELRSDIENLTNRAGNSLKEPEE